MTSTARTPAAPRSTRRRTCEPVELARYSVPCGERVLVGCRVRGEAILVDTPSGDEGHVYLVERNLDEDGNGALQALIAVYLADADEHQTVPMARVPL